VRPRRRWNKAARSRNSASARSGYSCRDRDETSPPPLQGQGNRMCMNELGIAAVFRRSVPKTIPFCSPFDSHMRLPCLQGGVKPVARMEQGSMRIHVGNSVPGFRCYSIRATLARLLLGKIGSRLWKVVTWSKIRVRENRHSTKSDFAPGRTYDIEVTCHSGISVRRATPAATTAP
jgi:hypothetical protein